MKFGLTVVLCVFAMMSRGWPELLEFNSGDEVKTAKEWRDARRAEVASAILPIEYGKMAAVPATVRVEEIGSSKSVKLPQFKGVNLRKLKVWAKMDGEDVTFVLQIWCPDGKPGQKWPLLLEGDGCWPCLSDRVIGNVTTRGWMVAQFNRCEVARDDRSSSDSTLLKWAWTYHRAIDALLKSEPRVNSSRIAITGHSRGGKTVLLAGATDERIFAVGENCSGCGGAAPCRDAPATAENIDRITKVFPYWFNPDWNRYSGREHNLPFDQHFLLSLIAPRKLFIRQAKDDLWANPSGAKKMVELATAVWTLYGKSANIGYSLREGAHAHQYDDYMTFLDFLDGERVVAPRYCSGNEIDSFVR